MPSYYCYITSIVVVARNNMTTTIVKATTNTLRYIMIFVYIGDDRCNNWIGLIEFMAKEAVFISTLLTTVNAVMTIR
jgi:hypothetical protein